MGRWHCSRNEIHTWVATITGAADQHTKRILHKGAPWPLPEHCYTSRQSLLWASHLLPSWSSVVHLLPCCCPLFRLPTRSYQGATAKLPTCIVYYTGSGLLYQTLDILWLLHVYETVWYQRIDTVDQNLGTRGNFVNFLAFSWGIRSFYACA